MSARIPKQAKPGPKLQTAVLDEARERGRQLHQPRKARTTDQSVTPPHGDPQWEHVGPEPPRGTHQSPTPPDQIADDEEGPGPAEGRTDNRAGG